MAAASSLIVVGRYRRDDAGRCSVSMSRSVCYYNSTQQSTTRFMDFTAIVEDTYLPRAPNADRYDGLCIKTDF